MNVRGNLSQTVFEVPSYLHLRHDQATAMIDQCPFGAGIEIEGPVHMASLAKLFVGQPHDIDFVEIGHGVLGDMVGAGGIEPPTSVLSGLRYYH